MHKVILAAEAERNFRKLPRGDQEKVLKKLTALENSPYLGKKLMGELSGFYSLRTWPYRIIYQIFKKQLIIVILKIAHRQGVYK